MKKNTTLFFSTLFSISAGLMFSQAPTFQWAKGGGSTGIEASKAISLDPAGNVIHAGIFENTVDFDPGSGTFNLTAVSTGGGYISKLDASGNFVWAVAIPGPAEAVATDASGNVFVTGTFQGTQDFDPGSGILNLTTASTNYGDAYVAKFDNSGNFIWAGGIGGTDEELPESIATDASGNVVLCGSFKNTVDFDPGSGTNTISSAGSADGFVLKLTGSGSFSWAGKFGSAYSGETALDIAVDATGNAYISGIYAGTVDFDPGPGYTGSTCVSGNDAYLVKLDASGNFVWVKGFGSIGTDEGNAVALDATGNVYLGGTFAGTVDFDPSSSASYTVTAVGSYDSYVSKFDALGNFIFTKTIGSSSFDKCKDLKISSSGHIVYVGNFSGTCDFDPSSSGTYTLASAGVFDGFASILDASGNFVWAGVLVTNSYDYFEGVEINPGNDIYLCGSYLFTNDFNMGTGTFNMTSAGNNDFFVTKLSTGFAGINEAVFSRASVKIYPNPSSGVFNIAAMSEFSNIKVYDQRGTIVLEKENDGPSAIIDLTKSAKGIYFYQLINKGEVLKQGKLVLE